MRLLFTSVGRPRVDSANGVELELYKTTEALAALGHDVMLACVTYQKELPVPGVDVRAFRPSSPSLALPKGMKSAISAWQPDAAVVFSVYSPFNTRFAWWCRAQGLPYVIRPCGGLGALNERVGRWKKRPYKLLFELPMLNHALFIWAGGDKKDIEAYGSHSPIIETPKGMDSPMQMSGSRSSVKVLKGLEDVFVFGFVGRLDPIHKGLDLAIEGFLRLGRSDTAMVLVGPVDGRVQKSVGDRLQQMDPNMIRFVGPLFQEDRDRFLGAVDAFFHTSRWEGGIPHAVIQAAAMRRPLLLTRQADPDEMLYKAGGCVRVELDPDSIAAGMRRLLDMSADDQLTMGTHAANSVMASFGWDKMAHGLVDGLRRFGVS